VACPTQDLQPFGFGGKPGEAVGVSHGHRLIDLAVDDENPERTLDNTPV